MMPHRSVDVENDAIGWARPKRNSESNHGTPRGTCRNL